MRPSRNVVLFALLLLLLSSVVTAQTFRGAIEGTITDSTGATVPGAKVSVSSTETGLTREVETDNLGYYRVPELPLGSYSVTVSKPGFRTQTAKGVNISVAGNQLVNMTLTAGEVKESVVVTADIPLVETSSNNQGGVLSAQQAEDLPINGRDYTKLLVLVPGATADPSGVADSPGSFGLFSVNGNRGRSNNYLLDGTDMNDGYRNLPSINEAGVFGTPATILPVDAIAELPIISGGEAEFGRNSGAIVNIVTKSGTNSLHGTAYEFFRNNALDARNFFNVKGTPENPFHNNQFGGSVGGPIFRDKTFFFVGYEGQRESGGTPATSHVPTTGDLADFTAAGGTLNPVIQNLLARNPWGGPPLLIPAVPGAVGGLQPGPAGGVDIPAANGFSNRVDSMIAKIDQNLRASDRLTGRYFFGDSDQSFPLGLTGGSSVPGYNTVTPTTVHVLSLSYTWVKSPKLLIEFRGGYNHFFESFLPQDVSFDPTSIGLNTGVTNPRDFGLPQIRVSGYSNVGATLGINRARTDINSQIFNNYSYTAGSHSLKWGYEYRRTTIDQFFDAGYRGLLRFQGLGTDDPATPFDDTIPVNTFFSGTTTGGRQATGNSDRSTAQNSHGLYFQDKWKLRPTLTLNLGLRWDYYGVIGEEKNRFSLFDPAVGIRLVDQLYPRDLNNFSPRVSFAWDMFGNSKTVLRAGWGVFYDSFSHDFFIGQLPFNTLNPGPAYNGVGSDPILFNFSPQPIASGAPVFLASDFAGTDVFTVDQNIATPYIQNFNVNVQHELTRNVALQVGYVGSQGRKLFRYRDINQGTTDAAGTFTQPFGSVQLPSPPNPAGTTPFYVNQFESSASSRFNALQVSANLRNWHGFSSVLNYTWSHSIDNASDGQDYVANASQPDNSFDPRREFASSNFDTRNRLTWNFTYQFPKTELGGALVNGWSVSGVLSVADGQPFTVHSFESFNGTQEFFERPDIIGDPFAGTSTPGAFLNLGAFAAPCNWDPIAETCSDGSVIPTGYHFGNEPRNAFVGPSFRNFDFSIAKDTKLTEKLNMQLRADFFNLFNHPNFTNPLLPSFTVDMEFNDVVQHDPVNAACNAGLVVGCRGIGQGFLPLTATPDVAIGNPFLGGGGARNIQLAVKFTF